MNPKHLNVRMDRATGDLWLTDERYRKPIKKITNITQPILLALCADLMAEDGTEHVSRDVLFKEADGQRWAARITIEAVKDDTAI